MTAEKLEKIYNEAYKPVYWTAMQMLKNQADAEDVVQDTFVSFIESYGDMEDTGKAVALLKKIAANKCLDRIKLSRTDAVEDEFFEDVEAVPEDFLPDSIIESEDARRIVMNIISNSLSDDVRRTLVMFYFDDMSTKEIADALGVPQGTVLRRLNSARNKIKKEVEKYEEDNKTKLFGMALPFLSKLFIKEAEQVPFKAMPAKIASLSASAQASQAGAATKTAASAAKKGTEIMINKVLIGSIAAVVGVGAVVGIAIGVMTKKADREPVKTDVTANETAEQTDGSGAGETGSASDVTSDFREAGLTDLSSRTMRDLTDDDLIITLGGWTGYMDGSLSARVVNGTVRVGDEVRLVGEAFEVFSDSFGGADHITTTVTEMGAYPAGIREPLETAAAGDEILIKFDGLDLNNSVFSRMVAIKEGSDLTADAVGVKVTATLADGKDWPVDPDDSISVDFFYGDFGPDGNSTACTASCYNATATLLERDGNTVTLFIKFNNYHYLAAPGLNCQVSYLSEHWAGGTINTVYLEEN